MDIGKVISKLPRWLRRHKLIQILLLISPRSRIQIVSFNRTAKVFADISESFPRQSLLTGVCDPEFFAIATPFLSKGGVYFDIGANYGLLSYGMMACLPKADLEYHLFEANKNVYQLLIQSKTLYPEQKVWLNHNCVTNQPGISKLNPIQENSSLSFIADEGTQPVANLVLDTYIREHSIDKINFLKIDIEGHEPLALEGMRHSLTAGVVEVIYIEVSTTLLSRSGFSVECVFEQLRSAGFYLFYVKQIDFISGIAHREQTFTLKVHDSSLTISEVTTFPIQHQTDILAIHYQSSYLLNWRSSVDSSKEQFI